MARHERRGWVDEEVVHVVPALAPDLEGIAEPFGRQERGLGALALDQRVGRERRPVDDGPDRVGSHSDRKSTRLNSSHDQISYAVFCLKKKKTNTTDNSNPEFIATGYLCDA